MESIDRKDLQVRYLGALQIALLIAHGMLVAVMDQAEIKFHFMKPTCQPTNQPGLSPSLAGQQPRYAWPRFELSKIRPSFTITLVTIGPVYTPAYTKL